MQVKKGCVTGILGPNGCGKSTLLNCIQRVVPYAGAILIEGRNIGGFKDSQMARTVAYVAQVHKPSFPYPALDIVLTGRAAYVSYLPRQEDIRIAMAAMEMVGVAHLAGRPYTQLSGGEKQLVMIARALCQESRLVLLDEPTSYLDLKNQHLIMEIIKDICLKQGITCLVTLHDPNLALAYCDEVLLFEAGRLRQGSSRAVITASAVEQVYGVAVNIFRHDGREVVVPIIDNAPRCGSE